MKVCALPIAFAFSATLAMAQAPQAPQAPQIPAHNCDPKPVFPAAGGIHSEARMSAFQANVTKYDACIKAYLAQRNASVKENESAAKAAMAEVKAVVDKHNAAMKAHEAAARAAVEEYNAVMTQLKKDQEAARPQ
jgi:hypothetical protein